MKLVAVQYWVRWCTAWRTALFLIKKTWKSLGLTVRINLYTAWLLVLSMRYNIDSKALTADTRSSLLSVLSSDPDNLGWSVRVVRYYNACRVFQFHVTEVLLLQPTGHFKRYAAPTANQSKSPIRGRDYSPYSRSPSARDYIDRGKLSQSIPV
jgi:hypothetical protein